MTTNTPDAKMNISLSAKEASLAAGALSVLFLSEARALRERLDQFAAKLSDLDFEKMRSGMIERARKDYALCSDNNIEVDDDAALSESDEACWVQAWLWVTKPVEDAAEAGE